jgi:hypothetical protein
MILICEPQCVGHEHVEVNVAFLNVFYYAFPGQKFVYLAEKNHLQYVRDRLSPGLKNSIVFESITVPARYAPDVIQFPQALLLFKRIFRIARDKDINKIIFCSITGSGLLSLKYYMKQQPLIKCIVIPHGILESLLKQPSIMPFTVQTLFKHALSGCENYDIKFLLLGPSIKTEIEKYIPGLQQRCRAINLPYVFLLSPRDLQTTAFNSKITFGSLGAGSRYKGTERFFCLAKEINSLPNAGKSRFVLIGSIIDKILLVKYLVGKNRKNSLFNSVEVPSGGRPLDRETYEKYARGINYAVYLYDSDSYKLTASGALLDAFLYLRPIIAIRNPYFEYYFTILGDIGYLCNDYEEVKQVIMDIIDNPPADRYRTQQDNLLKGRTVFDPEANAEHIRNIWETTS